VWPTLPGQKGALGVAGRPVDGLAEVFHAQAFLQTRTHVDCRCL